MLTEEQRHQNYLQLVETCKFFDDRERITEDWYEESKVLIQQYREWIPDYNQVHQDVGDAKFRQVCYETEVLMGYLTNSIRTTRSFDSNIYSMFVHKLKQLCDFLLAMEESSDNDLVALMKTARI